MNYMFLIYSQETPEGLSPDDVTTLMLGHHAVMSEAVAKGIFVSADALKPTATATTVRRTDPGYVTLDGPFAETKEQLAGYYILDCENLDDAIEWAKRIPTACKGAAGCVEIRPMHGVRVPAPPAPMNA
jgi:hypothetical protein